MFEACDAHHLPAEQYEVELDNLRAALEWALGGRDIPAGARLLHSTTAYWVQSTHLTEWRGWLERILLSQELLPTDLRAQILYNAARATLWQGNYDSTAVMRP